MKHTKEYMTKSNSRHTKNTLLQFAQCKKTDSKLQESVILPPKKNENLKVSHPSKNKTAFQLIMQNLTGNTLKVNRFKIGGDKLYNSTLREVQMKIRSFIRVKSNN